MMVTFVSDLAQLDCPWSVLPEIPAIDKLGPILVEGPWGSGKTYFLEKIYEPDRQAKAKAERFYKTPFLFVSLFGVKTAADVEKRMHRAASPGEVAVGKFVGTLISGGLESLKIKDATKTTFGAIERGAAGRHVDYILVFDDLERVEKGAFGEIMGLVNSLITTGRTPYHPGRRRSEAA